MSTYIRSSMLSRPEECFAVLIDVQEKLLPAMREPERLVARCQLVLKACQEFGVPVLTTEQYPSGLGSTVEALQEFVTDPVAKKRFSSVEALDVPAVGDRSDGRFRVVLIGIEAHVCVAQTAFDLQSLGYDVVVLRDAISSRGELDQTVACERFLSSGMTVTTAEAQIFEWCETAEYPQFKTLSRLIRDHS